MTAIILLCALATVICVEHRIPDAGSSALLCMQAGGRAAAQLLDAKQGWRVDRVWCVR